MFFSIYFYYLRSVTWVVAFLPMMSCTPYSLYRLTNLVRTSVYFVWSRVQMSVCTSGVVLMMSEVLAYIV